jgi:uncharacterized protein YdaU (DUF1376 family)
MKPPAFQFYPDNFLGGTALFSCVEVGAYIRLLCYQWDLGFLPNDTAKLSDLARCGQNEINAITHKFALCPDGKLRNERMEIEREKQRLYRAGQSAKGKASAKARFNHGSTTVQPSGQPKAQPNSNSPSPSPSPSMSPSPIPDSISKKQESASPSIVSKKPTQEEVEAYAVELGLTKNDGAFKFDGWLSNGFTANGKPVKDWKAAMRTWQRGGFFPSQKAGSPQNRRAGEYPETIVGKIIKI